MARWLGQEQAGDGTQGEGNDLEGPLARWLGYPSADDDASLEAELEAEGLLAGRREDPDSRAVTVDAPRRPSQWRAAPNPVPVATRVETSPDAVDIASRLAILVPSESRTVLSRGQVVFAAVALVAIAAATILAPLAVFITINTACVLFFSAATASKLAFVNQGLTNYGTIEGSRAPAVPNRTDWRIEKSTDDVRDIGLPVYTILLPVYHEAGMLGQLVEGIARLDYPPHQLDVKLLLEVDDVETRAAAEQMDLPPHVSVVVVPDLGPKGKPRACNAGLARARGEFLVIYDAEDRPEPDQLRKAVAGFREVDANVVCLQAKLNYFNRKYNLLTRWFTAEYSAWFDQLLPGLQAADVAIPLGGTSNHFRTARLLDLGGWDDFNVTEDADLGLRIFLAGWKTAILETTTYEEATSRYGNWIRQRSRWVKGYMQTWLMQMRNPIQLWRNMGSKAFFSFHLFFGASTIALLLNPLYWALTGLWFATRMEWIESGFPAPILYGATAALFIGNFACIVFTAAGAFGRRNYEDVKWMFLVPIYWLLMSVAAYKALIQLVFKPSYWEKTEHGFCRYDDDDVPLARSEPLQPVGTGSAE